MKEDERLNRIARALETLAGTLRELEDAGRGVPSVEKNVIRMRGALRVLEVQFSDLEGL
jgi:hypothetical protein